ncbi:FadR/GntR family transcriptional regulator [Shewanella sp. A14]
MNNFKPIKQVKASDEVYQQLKCAIFESRFVAGAKLPSERELIENFKVSRTVVREAIKGLEASGLVEIKQGAMGGAFVKQMTFERLSNVCQELFFMGKMSFAEVCQARLIIEPMVARLAAKHCTPEYAKQLRAASQSENDTLEYPETIDLRQQVHYILADMSDNRFLAAIVKSLLGVIRNTTNSFDHDTDVVHPAGLHDCVIEAVIAGDGAKAESEMYQHLMAFSQRLELVEEDYRAKHSID